MMNGLKIFFLKKHGGTLLAIVGLALYIIMVIFCLVFLSAMLLLGLLVVVPLLIIALIRRDRKLIIKRAKASCWALGVLVLFLFPAFWLIPQQLYVRYNRQSELITPDDPVVEDFAKEFLHEHPDYDNMSFEEKANEVCDYTLKKVVWTLDFETYGIAGHVATPKQCIEKGKDDCQGQACTMASVLLNLEFKYVWVVETPFHWYVLVRNPSKGELENGWEKKVEEYQDNGELITLYRDGQGSMPEWRLEEVVLIFNDKEILYPIDPIRAIAISWSATAFFKDDIFPIFTSYDVFFFLAGMFALAVPVVLWTDYMSAKKENAVKPIKLRAKENIKKVLVLGPLLFLVFLVWFFLQNLLWDYMLVISISEMTLIFGLASEPAFWKLIHIVK